MLTCRQLLITAATLLGLPSSGAAQQPFTVQGQVTRDDGTPIVAASVTIPSLSAGAVTKEDGSYAILIPSGRAEGERVAMMVRAIGYKPQTVEVTLAGDGVTQSFTLENNPLQLGEIVVTGSGTVSEAQKLTSVRNNVDSSLIQRSNEYNIVSALSAKAPNVQVSSTSGDPGASTQIQIRGANTLQGTSEPLWVVDGVPIDNSTTATAKFDGTGFDGEQGTYAPNRALDLNPADIENIEILKGAAAGAVYGARAGQGVILVTTKKGRAGSTTYSLRSSVSANDVRRFVRLQRSYGQGSDGVADACAASSGTAAPIIDCDASTRSWGPALAPGTPTFDHATEMFNTGWSTDNTLTISGGNDRTTFYVSSSLLNQDGIFKGENDRFNRISFRLNGSQLVNDRFKISGNVAYAESRQYSLQKGSNFSGVLFGAWRSTPAFDNRIYLDPVTGMHRSYAFPNPSAGSFDIARGYDNPFFVVNRDLGTSFADRVFGNVGAEWNPLAWLKVNYTLGVDYSGDDRVQGQAQASSNTPDARGQVVKVALTSVQVDHNLLATASYKVSPKLEGTFTLGQNLNTRSHRELGGTGDGLLAPTPFSLRNTASQAPPTDNETKIRIEGYFGQGTLDLSEQIFLKAGLRYDGSSTFGEDKRRNWFPSASGAWEFTRALPASDLLTYGKLRVAYGETGTQPDPYLASGIFEAGGRFRDDFGPTSVPPSGLFTPITRPTRGLKPERTREFEAGADLGLFKDLADLSFTWYHRKTVDAILPIPVPATTGFQLQYANGARIRNAGTEISLNVRPITRRNFGWDVGLQFSTNRNRVLQLTGVTEGGFIDYGGFGDFGLSVVQVGQPIGSFNDYDYVRCGRSIVLDDGFDVDGSCTPEQNRENALFLTDGTHAYGGDLGAGSGYPLLDLERRIMGSPQPDWTGSIRTGVRLGKWSLSGLLDIRNGGTIYNGTRGALNELGTSEESARRGETVTIGQNFLPGPVAGPGAGQQVVLTEGFIRNYYNALSIFLGQPFYEDAGFVKLREISVGYAFSNDPITRALGLSSVDLRVAGRNLHTWSKYTGIDPETNLAGAETGIRNIDWFNHPQAQSFIFTVTLNR